MSNGVQPLPAAAPRLILAEQQPFQPWRNGGGRTRELLRWPQAAPEWRLRISLAEVASDGPFSRFAGIERLFCVLEGAGVVLRIAGQERRCTPGHEPLRFSGEAAVDCALIEGPTTDLNLMHAGGRAEMHYARSAIPWRSDLQQRGLFTQHSGRWRSDRGSTLELPAHCLLWCELAAAETWHFTAAAAAAPASALWLGFTPD